MSRRAPWRTLQREARWGSIKVQVRGTCMAPMVRDGEKVTVRWFPVPLSGDVVVVGQRDGSLRAHRLLGYVPTRHGLALCTAGDRETAADPFCLWGRLVGVVVETEAGAVAVSWSQRARAAGRYVLAVAERCGWRT